MMDPQVPTPNSKSPRRTTTSSSTGKTHRINGYDDFKQSLGVFLLKRRTKSNNKGAAADARPTTPPCTNDDDDRDGGDRFDCSNSYLPHPLTLSPSKKSLSSSLSNTTITSSSSIILSRLKLPGPRKTAVLGRVNSVSSKNGAVAAAAAAHLESVVPLLSSPIHRGNKRPTPVSATTTATTAFDRRAQFQQLKPAGRTQECSNNDDDGDDHKNNGNNNNNNLVGSSTRFLQSATTKSLEDYETLIAALDNDDDDDNESISMPDLQNSADSCNNASFREGIDFMFNSSLSSYEVMISGFGDDDDNNNHDDDDDDDDGC